jgi:hypothetical protein
MRACNKYSFAQQRRERERVKFYNAIFVLLDFLKFFIRERSYYTFIATILNINILLSRYAITRLYTTRGTRQSSRL